MNREIMLCYLENHPMDKISHPNFSDEEYIYQTTNGNVYTEEGYLFEDWYSEGIGQHNGLRMREKGSWNDGWYVKEHIMQHEDNRAEELKECESLYKAGMWC